MKKLIIFLFVIAPVFGAIANNEYSNYSSVMAPKKAHSYSYLSRVNSRQADRLDKVAQVLGVLSVVSMTTIYYATDNKSLVPYSIPIGLAIGSFSFSIISNK